MRAILSSCLVFSLLAACAPTVALRFAPEAAAVGDTQEGFFATTRKDDGQGDPFSYERSAQVRYGRFDVSIPPNREPGSLPLPPREGAVDPRKHMLALGATSYDARSFRQAVAQQFRDRRKGAREAVVFVHGYNNNFASGLYRFAQLSHDLEIEGVQVQYSWPSRNSVLGYAYDRDSVLFARDGLENLLEELVAAGADRVIIVAHSMGSQLTMETLRQIAHKRNGKVMSSLAGVVLMSPDIDVSVFRTQARGIGRLPQPFVVLSSPRDKALTVSALISRDEDRLGNLTDVKKLEGLEVMLVDVRAFNVGDGHFNAATSPALIQLLSKAGDIETALAADARARVGLLPGAVLSVQGATQVILSPVLRPGERIGG